METVLNFIKKELRILHVEDNSYDSELIQRELRKGGINYSIKTIDSMQQLTEELKQFNPDIVLSDHNLQTFNSQDVLKLVKTSIPEVPFILISGSLSEQLALESINSGVDDYILKENLMRLPCAIKTQICKREIQKQKNISDALHRELSSAFIAIEDKNKEILDSITYAKYLQEAVMPSGEEINAVVEDHFILNRPKDIVSGDFYFVEPINARDGRKLTAIAVGDCTGHGVPGAFMSMLSYGILKNSLTEKDVNSSADVLNYLNSGILKVFRESSTESKVRDGMDISFCVLDHESLVLLFSGANNPGLVIKRDGTLIELIADKQPIGYHEQSYPFNTQTLQLEHGDMLYLFSDGFMDQFGGPKGKKVKYNKFVEKLLEASSKGPLEQKEFLGSFFNAWKGDLEQTDDVLLMGVKI